MGVLLPLDAALRSEATSSSAAAAATATASSSSSSSGGGPAAPTPVAASKEAAAAAALTPEERLAAMVEGRLGALQHASKQDIATNGSARVKASADAAAAIERSTMKGTVDGKRGTFLQLTSKEPVFEKVRKAHAAANACQGSTPCVVSACGAPDQLLRSTLPQASPGLAFLLRS